MKSTTIRRKPKDRLIFASALTVSDAENEEILRAIDELTEDDLQIVKSEYICVP